MKTMTRGLASAALVVSFGVGAAACSSDDTDDDIDPVEEIDEAVPDTLGSEEGDG